MKLMQTLHTIRHLKARQIVGQLAHRSRKLWEDPARLLSQSVPAFPGIAWRPLNAFLPPVQNQTADNILAGKLEFLSQLVEIGYPPAWNRTDLPKLWLYNLQYFEYLWAIDYPAARALVDDWIDQHAPSRGAIGWEPYPTSLRLVNWCGVFFDKFAAETLADDSFLSDRLWPSICRQMRWLESHVESHLMGNHLLENAVTLAIVGACFTSEDASRWLNRGLSILREQLPEQILEDGCHFERSPMYHGRVVYTLLLLKNLYRADVNEIVEQPLQRSLDAMMKLTHPDRQIALFNDSAFGIYNEPANLAAYASMSSDTDFGPFSLASAGYFGSRARNGNYILCDAGAIGPDHQPGHAHGDMLSFELSLRGQRVIVDAGVYEYPPGEMRAYCRSTRAHNTIEIDAQDQCEFWGSFRVARRGSPKVLNWSSSENGFELLAEHDGYARLPGKPIHRRMFCWKDSGSLEVVDRISSSSYHRIVSRLHVHPGCTVKQISDRQAEIGHSAGRAIVSFVGDGTLSLEQSYYCDHFGRRQKNVALAFSVAAGGQCESGFRIEDSDASD